MNLLGKAMDKAFWQNVRELACYGFFRKCVIDCWNEYCEDKEIPALKYSDFKMFFTCGDRATYEKGFFARRNALNAAAFMSLLYPGDEKYLNYLMDIIYIICDEYTWCLPAHQLQIEHNDNSHIDLFSSETAFALAEIYTMLNDRLDPLIKSRIEYEIDRRIFTSYEAEDPYEHWEKWTNNWVAVCTGSIACSYMLMRPDKVSYLLPRFERAMERFLTGYNDDGICAEGCAYWDYGFGFYVIYSEMVKTFTEGEINHFEESKVKNIATFIQKVFLSGKSSISFSDSELKAYYPIGIQHYLKTQYPEDVKVYDIAYGNIHIAARSISFSLRTVTWFNPNFYLNPDIVEDEMEFLAEATQWFVKKNQIYGFAAKGGNNAEPHNHNDVGTFIFAKGGRQIIADIGSAAYTRDYFIPEKRYNYFETQSLSHNLPIINGCQQKNGKSYKAGSIKLENGELQIEFADAYGIAHLASVCRKFTFEDDSVTLTDSFDYSGDGDIVERFVTFIEPRVIENTVILDECTMILPGGSDVNISTKTVKNKKLLYIIDVTVLANKESFSCKIK